VLFHVQRDIVGFLVEKSPAARKMLRAVQHRTCSRLLMVFAAVWCLLLLVSTSSGCIVADVDQSSRLPLNDPTGTIVLVVENHTTHWISNCSDTLVSFQPGTNSTMIDNVTIAVSGPGKSMMPSIDLNNNGRAADVVIWQNIKIVLQNVSVTGDGARSLLSAVNPSPVYLENVSIIFDGVTMTVERCFICVAVSWLASNVSLSLSNSNFTVVNVPLVSVSEASGFIVSIHTAIIAWHIDGGIAVGPHFSLFMMNLDSVGTLLSHVEVNVQNTSLTSFANTSGIQKIGTELYSTSLVYVRCPPGVSASTVLRFTVMSSSFLIQQVQDQTANDVYASLNGLLFFVDFKAGAISSVSRLDVNITGSHVNVTASTAAQLLYVSGGSRTVSLVDKAFIVVCNVSLIAFVTGFLPPGVTSRRGSVVAFEKCSLNAAVMFFRNVRVNVSVELGDGDRRHTAISFAPLPFFEVVPWVVRAQIVYFFQSSFNRSTCAVDQSQLQFTIVSGSRTIAFNQSSACIVVVELLTFSFVALSRSNVTVGATQLCASLQMSTPVDKEKLFLFYRLVQMAIITAFGSVSCSQISIQDNVTFRWYQIQMFLF
jgi:hypothetical protein